MTGIEQALKYLRQIKNIEAEISKLTLFIEKIVEEDHNITFKAKPVGSKKTKKLEPSKTHPEYPSELPAGIGSVYLVKGNFKSLGEVLKEYVGAKHEEAEETMDIRISPSMMCQVAQIFYNSLKEQRDELQGKLDKIIKKEGAEKIVSQLLQAL